ncbi:MAG: protein translocase subunit SecF [Candidatus Diapherotrites archaeon]
MAIFVYPGITQGIDLKGGTTIIVRSNTEFDSMAVENALLQNFNLNDLSVVGISSPAGFGLMIQFSENSEITALTQRVDLAEQNNSTEELIVLINELTPTANVADNWDVLLVQARNAVLEEKNKFNLGIQKMISTQFNLSSDARFQVREIGPTLGETFWETALIVSFIAFVLVILVIFAFFREIIPSFAVLAAAVFDIFCALALMSVFNIPLSLATIPTLLMLIGYSVDTDIMLTTRVLKRKEKTPIYRTKTAMKTGLTMTFTTLAALVAMLLFSYFVQIMVVFEIAVVLIFGLLGDILSTWLMNAPVLLWYIESKENQK